MPRPAAGAPPFPAVARRQVELKEGCDVIVTSNRAGGDYISGSRATFSGVNYKGEVILDDGNAPENARRWKLGALQQFREGSRPERGGAGRG